MSHFDPDPPVGFLQSCPTLSPGLFVFRIHEAAARDLRQPARSSRSRALEPTLATTGHRGIADTAQRPARDAAIREADFRRTAVPADPRCGSSVSLLECRTGASDPSATFEIFRPSDGYADTHRLFAGITMQAESRESCHRSARLERGRLAGCFRRARPRAHDPKLSLGIEQACRLAPHLPSAFSNATGHPRCFLWRSSTRPPGRTDLNRDYEARRGRGCSR